MKDFTESNLSKTKPAFRTDGAVTGNFGAGRRKGGSVLNDIPANRRDSLGNFPTRSEYTYRLREAVRLGASGRTLTFILSELDRLEQVETRLSDMPEPSGPHCYIEDHFVSMAQ